MLFILFPGQMIPAAQGGARVRKQEKTEIMGTLGCLTLPGQSFYSFIPYIQPSPFLPFNA